MRQQQQQFPNLNFKMKMKKITKRNEKWQRNCSLKKITNKQKYNKKNAYCSLSKNKTKKK